jgi:hypothetical protein
MFLTVLSVSWRYGNAALHNKALKDVKATGNRGVQEPSAKKSAGDEAGK